MKFKTLLGLCTLALALAVPFTSMGADRGGTIKVAIIGEPPSLDPSIATADVTSIISQHFFETLYTLDKNWDVTPLLADGLPVVSPDGKQYTIKIRKGVKFHDGTGLTSKDVVASLNRWLKISPRGKFVATLVTALEPVDDYTVKIALNAPYAPLPGLLAQNNGAAMIIPAANMEEPMTKFTGTGPYKFKERKADQYIIVERFAGYVSPPGATNGYGGKREQYADEIHFVPVPDANTRVEAAVAGQFDYVDFIPIESLDRIKGSAASEPVIVNPAGWVGFYMNTAEGLSSDARIRKAVLLAVNYEDCLAAAFGRKDFYTADGASYPKGQIWHSDRGLAGNYNVADAAKAKALLKEAGYKNEPLRILTSRQYEFHYKIVQVAAEYLKAAGFTVDVQVVDWSTLVQRRANPKLWDIYLTHSPFFSEPSTNNFMSPGNPVRWSTPLRDKVANAFNSEFDLKKRVALWADVQQAVMDEVPIIKIGNFNSLSAKSKKLEGITPVPWPFFWNASIKK